ncbi:hypothetical protein KXR56_04900 [Bacillus inaquosorum]|uniref:DUF5677 domain-containing protein n=1 Tax=Bacillus inaquosorum TaxID=483913 RepID=UPI003F148931
MKKSLINRKLDKDIQKEFNSIGRTFDSYVDFGEEMYKKLFEEFKEDELSTPLFTIFTHILNMIDSISIMSKKGATEGIIPLCRSLFEAAVYFEHAYTEPRKKGIIAYYVHYIQQEIKYRNMFNASTNSGKETFKVLRKELPHFNLDENSLDHDKTKYLYQFLEKDEVKEVYQDWIEKKPKQWYSLYTNCKNLRELSRKLEIETLYIMLYKTASDFIHAGATLRNIKVSDGKGGLSVRNFEEMPFYCNMAFFIINRVYQLISLEQFNLWYPQEAQKVVARTSQMQIKAEYEIGVLK